MLHFKVAFLKAINFGLKSIKKNTIEIKLKENVPS